MACLLYNSKIYQKEDEKLMKILDKRASGILLHISSLPSDHGIGDMGKNAYRFLDFLAEMGQSYWQILPLTSTSNKTGNSPYSSVSAFAGNKLFIDPEFLLKNGFIKEADIDRPPGFNDLSVDYKKVTESKDRLFEIAYGNFRSKGPENKLKKEFEIFCAENDRKWLDDYASFVAFKDHFTKSCSSWIDWPEEIKKREKYAIKSLSVSLKDEIEKLKFIQYIFFKQWSLLKEYANSLNIRIIGDIPIYVDYDSADVWTHSQFFKLDKDRNQLFGAGVPPDFFSNIGQLWGNPVYDWERLKQEGFRWWIKRLEHNFRLFDLTRFDHFRGIVAYWEVKRGKKDARNGKWVRAFPDQFITKILKHFGRFPIIAEDLGGVTPDVQEVIKRFEIAGTKVLFFAFLENFPKNPYLPHNYIQNCVAYTGTHDNNTAKGWFMREGTVSEKKNLSKYLGKEANINTIHKDLIRLVLSSVANLAIIPLQDILGLDETARMNRPSIAKGNWKWRFKFDKLSPEVKWFREMTENYDRSLLLK